MRMSDVVVGEGVPRRRRRQRQYRAWRDGGASTARWGLDLLGWSVLILGVGLLGARAVAVLIPSEDAPVAAQAVIWLCFAAPAAWAWTRSRPRGLLGFRAVDVMYGVVFGAALRMGQGTLAGLDGRPLVWPSVPSVGGGLPEGFLVEAAGGTAIAPLLEEAFFRGVVLVCVYTVVRRWSGRAAGRVAAVAISSALFVIAHLLLAPLSVADVWSLVLVGVVTSALVLGTGRLWAAVATHMVFNATGFALVAVGTLLA